MIFLSALILNNILLFASSFSHLKSYTFVQTPKKYKMWRAQCLTQIKWKLMLLLITVGSSNLEQYALYIFCWNIDIKTNRMYSCWQLFETNNFNYSSKNSLFVCLFCICFFFCYCYHYYYNFHFCCCSWCWCSSLNGWNFWRFP